MAKRTSRQYSEKELCEIAEGKSPNYEKFRRFADLQEALIENPYPTLTLPPSIHESQNKALKRELEKALPAPAATQIPPPVATPNSSTLSRCKRT